MEGGWVADVEEKRVLIRQETSEQTPGIEGQRGLGAYPPEAVSSTPSQKSHPGGSESTKPHPMPTRTQQSDKGI